MQELQKQFYGTLIYNDLAELRYVSQMINGLSKRSSCNGLVGTDPAGSRFRRARRTIQKNPATEEEYGVILANIWDPLNYDEWTNAC